MEKTELMLRRMQAQYLLTTGECHAVASGLCGLQAQFLRNAVHALRSRSTALNVSRMVKTWTLRGTVHLLPDGDLPLYIRHCGTAEEVCDSAWYRWTKERGHANPPQREQELARRMVELIGAGTDTRDALREEMRASGMTELEEERVFNPWGGMIAELANIGVLAFHVGMVDDTHPDETKRYRLLASFTPMEEEAARLEIARRYLLHYGPVTLRDAAYFLHWTQAEARSIFTQLGTETLTSDDDTYWYVPASEPSGDMPPVCLLAGFDPLMLGYRKEDNPFLPREHLRGIYNLAGIVNPAILLYGRVVGKWKETKGKIEMTAFESIDARDRRQIEQEVERWYDVKRLIWK